jgi:hypothetical protein
LKVIASPGSMFRDGERKFRGDRLGNVRIGGEKSQSTATKEILLKGGES